MALAALVLFHKQSLSINCFFFCLNNFRIYAIQICKMKSTHNKLIYQKDYLMPNKKINEYKWNYELSIQLSYSEKCMESARGILMANCIVFLDW